MNRILTTAYLALCGAIPLALILVSTKGVA